MFGESVPVACSPDGEGVLTGVIVDSRNDDSSRVSTGAKRSSRGNQREVSKGMGGIVQNFEKSTEV